MRKNDISMVGKIHEHLQLHASQYKQKTQHPSRPLHKLITYFNSPRLKKTLSSTTAATQHTFPQTPHTVTTTGIKTNMRHIHTSIVSRHLATGGNNKILRTPPPHISSSEEILPTSLVEPLPNSEQINHTSSNHTYTKSTPKHPRTRHTSSLDLWTDPAGMTELLTRSTENWQVDHYRDDLTPPLTRVKGVGRQQHTVRPI